MKLTNETDILDERFRKKVITEINGTENIRRKAEAFKRYECFKDMTDRYVLELLLQQFDSTTVREMQYAVTNISFSRKIIDKLSRVYSYGVKRSLPKAKDTKQLEAASKKFKFNAKMKKLNRYLKLFKNVMAYVYPYPEESGKFCLDVKILPPFLYDVIEDPNEETEPMVVILSNYRPERNILYSLDPATANRTRVISPNSFMNTGGDGIEQVIADDSFDKPQDEYVWWSKHFNFVTDKNGKIKSQGYENPILKLPFVNFAEDQDNGFWAYGGNDLSDGCIKINTFLTNLNHVAITQGYGQLYMTGKNLPKSVKTGPNHCIQIGQEEGEPSPSVGFLTANPPISDLKTVAEMYVALLLSTNNLSTSGFSSSLNGARDFASGIAMMIDKAESNEDVEDQAQIFRDKEPKIWEKLKSWYDVYNNANALSDELKQVPIPDVKDMTLSLQQPKVIMSEGEELDIIQKRRDLGLNTEIELLMRDDPSLDEKSAAQKLLKIQEEKLSRMEAFASDAMNSSDSPQPQEQNDMMHQEDEQMNPNENS